MNLDAGAKWVQSEAPKPTPECPTTTESLENSALVPLDTFQEPPLSRFDSRWRYKTHMLYAFLTQFRLTDFRRSIQA